MKLQDLEDAPIDTIVEIGGLFYRKTLHAGRTMPCDDFYERWHRLELGPEVTLQTLADKLRRFPKATVIA